jgi:hypothetical protein
LANTECDLGDDVAKKKKKMTKAQAAAARYDQTEESAKRARARENQQLIRKSVANAEKQASKSRGYMMWIPIISILVIVVLSLVFTMGPGMMLGGQ